jgi:hypothetical protein
VPPAPPRPQGIERNVVITLWDFGTDKSFVHDVVSTDERNPTANAYGPIYGPDFSAGAIAILDPVKNTKSMINVPLRNENDRKLLRPLRRRTWQRRLPTGAMKSSGTIRSLRRAANGQQGPLWFHTQTRADLPDYCKEGSNNPFAKNFPMPAASVAQGRRELRSQDGQIRNDRYLLVGGT